MSDLSFNPAGQSTCMNSGYIPGLPQRSRRGNSGMRDSLRVGSSPLGYGKIRLARKRVRVTRAAFPAVEVVKVIEVV